MVAVSLSRSDSRGGGGLAVSTSGRAWGSMPVVFLNKMLIARLREKKKTPLHKVVLLFNYIQMVV